jgi:predicted nucleic acid-binding protein
MTAVLVDSNVLLDVLTEDKQWFGWSSEALEQASESGRLVINPVIYAEISVRFSRIEELEFALPKTMIDREAIAYEAAFLAGKVFMAYRKRGGVKTAPLPDFFIGAHAATAGYRLLTRDSKRYRQYFPTIELLSPS